MAMKIPITVALRMENKAKFDKLKKKVNQHGYTIHKEQVQIPRKIVTETPKQTVNNRNNKDTTMPTNETETSQDKPVLNRQDMKPQNQNSSETKKPSKKTKKPPKDSSKDETLQNNEQPIDTEKPKKNSENNSKADDLAIDEAMDTVNQIKTDRYVNTHMSNRSFKAFENKFLQMNAEQQVAALTDAKSTGLSNSQTLQLIQAARPQLTEYFKKMPVKQKLRAAKDIKLLRKAIKGKYDLTTASGLLQSYYEAQTGKDQVRTKAVQSLVKSLPWLIPLACVMSMWGVNIAQDNQIDSWLQL